MKLNFLTCVVFLIFNSGLHLAAQGLTVSGLLDSTVSLRAGAGDAPDFSCGMEEYANLRFQARLKDRGRFEGAVNFFAAAGDYAYTTAQMAEIVSASGAVSGGISPTPFTAGQNYIAGIELERLYFRLNGENTDFDGGLFRLPFGYGQVWGPSDFLNSRNPLKPDARPRAILGAAFSWYPSDKLKLLGFGTSPRNPFSQNGEGGFVGISMDQHWNKASVQALYSYEMPQTGSNQGIHRAGVSVKADLELGFVLDALYSYNHEAGTGHDGLSFSAGFDYSFFKGDLIVLVEYLYNGASSSTSAYSGGSFFNEHYLYTGFTWSFSDFTNAGLALVSGFSDVSFTPIVTVNHDLFQGATLIFSAQVPLDRNLFSNNGQRGELGPLPPDYLQPWKDPGDPGQGKMYAGNYFNCSVKLRLRF